MDPSMFVGTEMKTIAGLKICCKKLWDQEKFEEVLYTTCYLLRFLHDNSHEFNAVVVDFFKQWFYFKKTSKTLPSPISLVRKWVKNVLGKVNEGKDGDTLHSLISTSCSMGTLEAEILLEQELLAYEEIDQNLGHKMRRKIMDSLLEIAYAERTYSFKKARILIKRRALGDDAMNCIEDYIIFLSEAVNAISELDDGEYPFPHQLAVCYSLRALCYLEKTEPKVIFQDISAAIQIWTNIFCDHSFAEVNRRAIVSETLPLLYHMLDFLSAKGHLDYHYDIYRLIIELCMLENVSLDEIVVRLWEFRRFSHASCCSPINNPFCEILKKYDEKWENADFWKRCFQKSNSFLIGFQQQFYPFEACFGSSPTSDNVKDAISSLSTDRISFKSISHAAHLYYELSETLHSKGKLKWALYYALKAYRLRVRLLLTKFASEKNETKLGFQKYTGYSDLKLSTLVATEFFKCFPSFGDSKGYILTPSYVLQCFLESSLQLGILHEKMGDEEIAMFFLWDGISISRSQDLPAFEITFSLVLGRIHKKKQGSTMPTQEFKIDGQLKKKGDAVTCSKCKVLLKTSFDLQEGYLSAARRDARNCYRRALNNLIPEWEEAIGSLNETTEIVNCWQSLPSDTVKSISVRDLIQMKWDSIRRSLALKLLSSEAETEESFLKNMSLLVGENPFSCTYSCDKLLDLIGMEVPGDVLAIERATLLLNVTVFCLKKKKNKGSNCFNQPQIAHERIKSWLLLAFTLSQDVPMLLRKVSRLLAALYFDPRQQSSLPTSPDALSANHYALFYHQASIGTHFENQQQMSRMFENDNFESEIGVEESGLNRKENRAPQDNHVTNFFKNLPRSSVVSISFFGQDSKSVLEEKDVTPRGSARKRKNGDSASSWMLFSSVNSDGGMIVLFPLHSIPQVNVDYDNVFPGGEEGRQWTCHWGVTTVDKLAPEFKLIINEISTDRRPIKENKAEANRELKRRRRSLDGRLSGFLQSVEDTWFGSLKTSIFGRDDPIVLVLDHEVQMLPWEDMGILRERPVYLACLLSKVF